jgi:sortase A
VGACIGLGYCAYFWGWAEWKQYQGNRALTTAIAKRKPTEGGLVGRIEIPRLHLSAVIFEGTSDSTLAGGVGHLTGSTAPGHRGNVVLAAHRDTFFRSLREIQKGDNIAVTTPAGVFSYVVESTAVTDPDDTTVIKPTLGDVLTLVTCYPFSYVGNAPERFIVRGRAVRL